MLRTLGALFVVAGTSGFGYLIACGLNDRAAILRCLAVALQHLESDIMFAALPLQAALRKASQAIGGEVGSFLNSTADKVGKNDGEPLSKAWTQALKDHAAELMLRGTEIEALAQLGAVLGGSDREDQCKHLAMARATLAQYQAEAEIKAGKTRRVWQYLGFALGALTVIFLY